MAITLTGFGGVEEIGGNAFLLDDGRSRLLLDFGKRFGADKLVEAAGARPGWGDYFDEYLKPRTFRYISDLRTLGLIPDLPGAYRPDLGGEPGPRQLDGVIVSHAHMDHAGLIGLLKPDIPISASPESKAILQSIQETGLATAENEFASTKAKGVGMTKKGTYSTKPQFDDGPKRTYSTGATGDVGGWDIQHFGVDHSIPGARATLLSGPEATIAYTGDFRMHGRSKHLTDKFVERAGGIQVLITEGTNVHGPHNDGHAHTKSTDEEVAVEAQVHDAISREEARPGRTGFIGISYPPRDLDRFLSLWTVARRVGRRFVLSPKQAHLLDGLRAAGRMDLPDPRTDMSLAVHFEAAGKGLILGEAARRIRVASSDLSWTHSDLSPDDYRSLLVGDYKDWAIAYLHAPTRVCATDIGRDPRAFLFSISFWSINELLDIFPDPAAANGLYIHSQTQPFNDEMLQDARKLTRWLRLYNLDRADTHVSGHLGEEDLAWVLDEIRPRTLVPIHTQAASITAAKYRDRSGNRALLPVWGQPLSLA